MTESVNLLVSTSPFLKGRADTAWIMWQVNFSLVPVALLATWYFGVGVLLIIGVTILGAAAPEWAYNRSNKAVKPIRSPLKDGSAVLTGLLLALTLPPGIPLWMAFVGGFVAVLVGKTVFGGIGSNVFNPALVGRAFLQAAFPASLTNWLPQGGAGQLASMPGSLFAVPFLRAEVDGISAATPLAQMKFDGVAPEWIDLAVGKVPGSVGETGAVLILICGLYLVFRGVVNWRIPLSILATVWLAGTALHAYDPAYADGLFHLTAGGLMLGALYMATDPVTSPMTQAGCWVFGVSIGLLVVVIRVFGGLPEGVMYAILFLNAFTPLINRVTQPRTFGTRFKPGLKR